MTTGIKDIAHDVQRDQPHLGSKADVENTLKSAFGVILERVAKGDTVTIRGFGTFHAKVFKGRTLKSPLMEGGSVDFGDSLVLRFRQSLQAKKTINDIAGEAPAKAKPKANGKSKAKKASAKKASTKKSKAKKPAKKPEASTEAEA